MTDTTTFPSMSECFERSCKRIAHLEKNRFAAFSMEIKRHGEIWKNVVEYIKRVSGQNRRLVAYLEAQAVAAVKWSEMIAQCPIAALRKDESKKESYTNVDSVGGAIRKLASMDGRASVKVTEWAGMLSENLVNSKLKPFIKIFDSDVHKAFQKGSMFTKRFEDSSANVRTRFNSYCKAYEKQMKKVSRNAAGLATTKGSSSISTSRDESKLENELFMMEVAYRSEVVNSAKFRDQYLKEMAKIFDVIKLLEQRRAKVVKNVLTSFLQNLRLRFGSALYPVSESLLAGVASIDPLLEIKTVLMKSNVESKVKLPPTLTLSKQLREGLLKSPMIVRQGVLELKDDGIVLSGWKSVHAVITIGRVLHVFEETCVKDASKNLTPLWSVDLEHARVVSSKEDDVTITITEVVSGLIWNSSNSYVLRIKKEHAQRDILSRKNWIFAMRCQFTAGGTMSRSTSSSSAGES